MLQKGLIAALLAGLLSGCAHYMYDGQKFTDRSKAEAAQRAQFDNVRSAAAFKPRAKPVAKNLRFVMPTKTLMLERGILPTGSADGRDYVATTLHADFRFTGELIRQRNIFENMSVEESADAGHVAPKPGESVIYCLSASRGGPENTDCRTRLSHSSTGTTSPAPFLSQPKLHWAFRRMHVFAV